jgi:hypothetical protein
VRRRNRTLRSTDVRKPVDCNNDGVSEIQEPQTPTKPKLVTHVRLSGAAFGAFGRLRPLAAGHALVDRNLWLRLCPISHSLGPSASKLMHAPGLPLRVIVSLVLTFMAVAGLAHGSADPMRVEAPSDRELISIFQAHRPEFDRLREMVTEDMHAQSYFSEATIGLIAPISRRMDTGSYCGFGRASRWAWTTKVLDLFSQRADLLSVLIGRRAFSTSRAFQDCRACE